MNDARTASDKEFAVWMIRLLLGIVKAIETRYNIDKGTCR